MPPVIFEPTIPASDRSQIIIVLHRSATGIGHPVIIKVKVNVKFSRYRPKQALGDPEVKASGFSRLSTL
jgi:hypothetical protein